MTHGWELIDHYKEESEVELPIFESIEDLSEEQFHEHCFVDVISNKCSIDQNLNSNHIIQKEEDQNDKHTSLEESIIKMCEDDNEPKSDLINLPSCQMNEYNDKSNEELLLMSESNQECSLLQPSSCPLLYKESSRNASLDFDNIPHSLINLDREVISPSHDVDLLSLPKFENLSLSDSKINYYKGEYIFSIHPPIPALKVLLYGFMFQSSFNLQSFW